MKNRFAVLPCVEKGHIVRITATICTAAVLVALSAGTASAVVEFDQDVTPDIIFGSGNSNGLFTVDQANGVELGLRAKIPFVGTIHSNGDGTYSYTLAELLAAHASQRWNFDWTVNTDYLDSSAVKIDDLTYLLEIDFEPSLSTNFLAFDPITPGVAPLFAPFYDHSIGDNTTANGAGVEAGDAPTYLGLIASKNVLQQSWRHSFFPIHPTLTYDPTVGGIYDIVLTAFDSGGGVAASTSIQVIIGCGDGVVSGGEECDDGNLVNDDGCDSNCTVTGCGNRIVTSGEECDDANVVGGDGCDENCILEICGNGILQAGAGEACDDGNSVPFDGCNPDCTLQEVPATSQWSLIVVALLLFAGITLLSRRLGSTVSRTA